MGWSSIIRRRAWSFFDGSLFPLEGLIAEKIETRKSKPAFLSRTWIIVLRRVTDSMKSTDFLLRKRIRGMFVWLVTNIQSLGHELASDHDFINTIGSESIWQVCDGRNRRGDYQVSHLARPDRTQFVTESHCECTVNRCGV